MVETQTVHLPSVLRTLMLVLLVPVDAKNWVTTPVQRPQSHSLQPDQNSPPFLPFLHYEHYHNNAVNSWLFYLTQLQDTSVSVFPLTIQDVSPSIPSANNIFIQNTVTVLGSLQSPFQAIKPCIRHFLTSYTVSILLRFRSFTLIFLQRLWIQ